MANINIKELLAADTVSELVDKINFNFDQLLLNGGGPLGPQGKIGDIGPIGPRGTIWFTVADLYTTDASPMWTGTPEMVNDINQPSFPQFNGDPNKFLPVGLGGVVESTLVFGTPSKPLRDGDLYIQETDDTLNSFNSFDGDIWEYDSVSESWLYTGVNIKGAQGISGVTGFSQWSRINDALNDVVYPTQESGQDIPKILLGTSTDIINSYAVGSILTINTEIEHIRLANPIIHDDSNISGESGLITMTSDGILIIEGSNTSVPGDNKEIIIRGYSNNRIISGEASDPVPTQYVQDSTDAVHEFTGGRLLVKSKNQNNITHQLLNNESADIGINIILKPTGASNIHRINADNTHDLVLQGTLRNLGIGFFNNTNPVGSKLSVDGNVSIGSLYKSNTSGPTNGLIVQGNTGIGTNDLVTDTRLTVEQQTTGTSSSGIVIRNSSSLRSANMIRFIGFDSSNTWGLGLNNDDSFILRDNSSTVPRIVVTQTGKVGIGTGSPSTRLSVYDGDITDVEVLRVSSAGGPSVIQGKSYIGLDFFTDNGDRISPVRIGVEQTTSSNSITGMSGWRGAFVIQTRPDNTENQLPVTRLAVMPNGNVGIGTTNVQSPLQVQSTGIVTGTLNPWAANINPSIRITSTATGFATAFPSPSAGVFGTSTLNTITGGKIITSASRIAGSLGNTDARSLTVYGRTFIDLTQPGTTWGKTASEPALTIGTGAGIFQSVNNQLQLATNSIERVRINPNGGVQLYDDDLETTNLSSLSLPANSTSGDTDFSTWGPRLNSTSYDRLIYITWRTQQQIIRSGIRIRIKLIGVGPDRFIYNGALGEFFDGGIGGPYPEIPPRERFTVAQWNYNFILPAGVEVQFEYKREPQYQRSGSTSDNNYNIFAYRLGKK